MPHDSDIWFSYDELKAIECALIFFTQPEVKTDVLQIRPGNNKEINEFVAACRAALTKVQTIINFAEHKGPEIHNN